MAETPNQPPMPAVHQCIRRARRVPQRARIAGRFPFDRHPPAAAPAKVSRPLVSAGISFPPKRLALRSARGMPSSAHIPAAHPIPLLTGMAIEGSVTPTSRKTRRLALSVVAQSSRSPRRHYYHFGSRIKEIFATTAGRELFTERR